MGSVNVVEITDENFKSEVLDSTIPVLVDFWAEWCPPCRALTPTIDKLADAYAGKVKVAKVNTDASRDVVSRYRINSIPTVLLFKAGQVVQALPGLRKEEVYREVLDQNV
ncbi:MAG TPA: thioredoxin [Tepidisphaeraceae bacterium]|jgi:thioredoxin 1